MAVARGLSECLAASVRPAADAYVVAYSGGMDSHVLLHAAAAAKLPGLCAVHVHHGLQAVADDWVHHASTVCAAIGVPLTVCRVALAQKGFGTEAAARQARYQALAEQLPANAVLLVAHHQDDQAETLLLRLLRGTGVDGMAGMAALRPFATGQLWRPFLQHPRKDLLQYAQQHGLNWIEDAHNQNLQFDRSWLRSQIIPQLRQRYPHASAQLSHAAQHCHTAAQRLKRLDHEALNSCVASDDPQAVQIPALLALPSDTQAAVLRAWLERRALPIPSAEITQHIFMQVIAAKADAMPLLAWPGAELRRYRDRLYASAPLPDLVRSITAWDGQAPLHLGPRLGWLSASGGLGLMSVRYAQGGERILPAGDRCHRSLKYLCQSHGIAPWLRTRLPLIYHQDRLVSVAGWWNAAPSEEFSAIVRWHDADLPALPAPC